MDIVEVNGQPRAKRGKLSGSKRVLRCPKCHKDKVVPCGQSIENCDCGERYSDILLPFVEDGKVIAEISKPEEIRKYVLAQVADLAL